jgi:hypothetical protein
MLPTFHSGCWSCVCVSLPRSFPPIGLIGTSTSCWRTQPLRVVVFNPVERWSRDATEETAEELDRRISSEGREVSEALQEFVESNIGRKIGVQLALPLRLQT